MEISQFGVMVACEQALCLGKNREEREGKGEERACRQTLEAAIPPSCNHPADHLSVRSLSVNQFAFPSPHPARPKACSQARVMAKRKGQQCLLMSEQLSLSCDGFCGASEQEARAHVTCRLADDNLERIPRLFSNL